MSDEATPHITCHIELDAEGPSDKVVTGWVAEALRKIATKLEADEYEDGHHDVTDGSGRKIGEVYLDFYEVHG